MLKMIIVAAGAIAVIAAEKIPHVLRAPMHARIETGIVLALPFAALLILVIWLEARKAKAKAAAGPARRPSYSFTSPQGRR